MYANINKYFSFKNLIQLSWSPSAHLSINIRGKRVYKNTTTKIPLHNLCRIQTSIVNRNYGKIKCQNHCTGFKLSSVSINIVMRTLFFFTIPFNYCLKFISSVHSTYNSCFLRFLIS